MTQRRTQHALPHQIQSAINDITEDHESGARQLALKALSALQLSLEYYPLEKLSWKEIVNCAWLICQARPSMGAAIETAILRALNELEPIYPSSSSIEI